MADLIATERSNIVAIADAVRELYGTNDEMTLGTIGNKIDSVNSEVQTQTDLINQIISKLEGKAVGGTDGSCYKEIVAKQNYTFYNAQELGFGSELHAMLSEYPYHWLALQTGFSYRVNVDGVYYITKCTHAYDSEGNVTAMLLGNTSFFGDETVYNENDLYHNGVLGINTGEPFLLFATFNGILNVMTLIQDESNETTSQHEFGIELCFD